jgi:hypothetical protein
MVASGPFARQNPNGRQTQGRGEAKSSLETDADKSAEPQLTRSPELSPSSPKRNHRVPPARLWLARRFPETFDDIEATRHMRRHANDAIEHHLQQTAQGGDGCPGRANLAPALQHTHRDLVAPIDRRGRGDADAEPL